MDQLKKEAQGYALRESYPDFVKELEAKKQLKSYLRKRGEQAAEMANHIRIEMMMHVHSRKLPYMESVTAMERIPRQVSELVDNDLIFSPPGS